MIDNLKDYMEGVKQYKVLSREEEIKAATLAKEGNEEARDLLILSNLKFVVRISKLYLGCGLSMEELISEGNLGLINALKFYDPARGNQFISYAVYWIKQAIIQAISEHTKIVRVPLNVNNQLVSLRRQLATISETGREITSTDYSRIADENHVKRTEILHMLNVTSSASSLDTEVEIKNGETFKLGDFIKGSESLEPDSILVQENLRKELGEIIKETLSPQEAEIITMRFSMGKEKGKTLSEIGKLKQISKERVRQIEKKALLKLKNNIKTTSLKYLIA